MAFKSFSTQHGTTYSSDGTNELVLIEQDRFIRIEGKGISLDFEKHYISLKNDGGWITITNFKESLQFLYTEIKQKNPEKSFVSADEIIAAIKDMAKN